MNTFTEDTLVQQTTAKPLEPELGWDSVYAYNKHNCGLDSDIRRADSGQQRA